MNKLLYIFNSWNQVEFNFKQHQLTNLIAKQHNLKQGKLFSLYAVKYITSLITYLATKCQTKCSFGHILLLHVNNDKAKNSD